MEKSGGRPKKETSGFQNKKTNGFQKEETKTKPNVNVNDNVNVNVNDNDNDNDNVSDGCVNDLQKIIDFYNNNIGFLTPYGLEVLQDYAKEIDIDAIIYAMQISVEADKRNIKYIRAILNNWSKKGIKTLVEAQKENQSFNKKVNISAWEDFMNE